MVGLQGERCNRGKAVGKKSTKINALLTSLTILKNMCVISRTPMLKEDAHATRVNRVAGFSGRKRCGGRIFCRQELYGRRQRGHCPRAPWRRSPKHLHSKSRASSAENHAW